MIKANKSLTTLALLLPVAAFASGFSPATKPSDDVVQKIHAALQAEGMEIQEIEIKKGGFEVETTKGGQEFEIYMDADLNILSSEIEGDNDDQHDD